MVLGGRRLGVTNIITNFFKKRQIKLLNLFTAVVINFRFQHIDNIKLIEKSDIIVSLNDFI